MTRSTTSQISDLNIPELDDRRARHSRVVLQANVALPWTDIVDNKVCNHLRPVEPHVKLVGLGRNAVAVPLSRGFRRQTRSRLDRIDRTRLVQRVARGVSVGIESRVVNLNFVAAAHSQLPVCARLAAVQRRKSDEYAGVAVHFKHAPVQLQLEIAELLPRVPEQAQTAERLQHVSGNDVESASPCHLPAVQRPIEQRTKGK